MAKVWLLKPVDRNEDGQVVSVGEPVPFVPEHARHLLKNDPNWMLHEKDHEDGMPVVARNPLDWQVVDEDVPVTSNDMPSVPTKPPLPIEQDPTAKKK